MNCEEREREREGGEREEGKQRKGPKDEWKAKDGWRAMKAIEGAHVPPKTKREKHDPWPESDITVLPWCL